MPIRLACASCGKSLQVRDELVGKKVKCPRCATVFLADVSDTVVTRKAPGHKSGPSSSRHPGRAGLKKSSLPAKPRSEAGEGPPASIGPFELLEKLGRGGTAIVYKGRHKDTGQFVAIKIGHDYLALEPTHLERFKREFTVFRELRHPNLIQALDFGEIDGVPYLVLEFAAGESLEKHVKEKGPLPLREALDVFQQVCEGLRFLHENQILHRDIKPGNILLDEKGQVKLADFGLLKNLTGDTKLTRSGQGMGTMEYGAPEQFEDAKNTDYRCDLYSLAGTLYTAMTGHFPFGVASHIKILQRKLHNQFVPLRQLLPTVPAPLDNLVARCLNSRLELRPSTIDEFLGVLQGVSASLAPRPTPSELKAAPLEDDSTGGPERRATIRIPSTLPAAFVPFHQRQRGLRNATILDVSEGGLRIRATHPFAVHTVLEVVPAGRPSGYLVEVRWVTKGTDQGHVLGCAFLRPVPEEELKGLCAPEPDTDQPPGTKRE